MKTYFIHPFVLITFFALSCKGPEGPQGPAGPPGSGGVELLTDPSIQPRVLTTYPPPNSIGPYLNSPYYYSNNQMEIRFNKIMDRASVARAIVLSSPATSVFIDSSAVMSLGGDIFSFYPVELRPNSNYPYSHRWKVGETYSLRVNTPVWDINNNTLQAPFSMRFRPEPYFRVASVDPRNGSTEVSTESWVVLYFNSLVDTSLFRSISISPLVFGQWVLYRMEYDTDSLAVRFSHNGLNYNTNYTVIVAAGARDKYGNTMPQQYVTTLSTASFRVYSTYPTSGSVSYSLNPNIRVTFTGTLDTGTVRRSFRINPAASGTIPLYQNDGFTFFPDHELIAETTYTVTIDTSIRGRSGARLSAPHVFTFLTPAFQVMYTSPQNGDHNVPRGTNIYVQLNAKIDTGSVRSAVTVSGATGRFSLYEGTDSFSFYPDGSLPPNVTITVNIATSLRSKGGVRLKLPYAFSFVTGP